MMVAQNALEPSSIHVFMPDGDPYGMRQVTLDGWDGIVFVAPVEKVNELLQELRDRNGVYVLIRRGSDETVYVGRASDLERRLGSHELLKEGSDLNADLIAIIASEAQRFGESETSYLERRLIEVAKESRSKCINKQTPTIKANREVAARVEIYVKRTQILIPILGFEFATPLLKSNESLSSTSLDSAGNETNLRSGHPVHRFILQRPRGGEDARLDYDGQSYTLLKGSLLARSDKDGIATNVKALRTKLSETGQLRDNGSLLELMSDVQSHSFSEAAGVVTGSSINGLDHWKHQVTGLTVNEWLSSQSTSGATSQS